MNNSVYERIKENSNIFKDKKVLVIGDIALDHSYYCKPSKSGFHAYHASEQIFDIEPGGDDHGKVGSANNISLFVNSLKAESFLITVTGKDSEGKRVKEILREDNISHKLIELSEIQTVTRLRFFIRKEDNADYELAYRMDKEPDYELSYKAATKYVLRNRKFFELLKEKIQASDVLIINDTEKGFISERFVEVLSSIVKEENNERDKRKAQHIIIIADPKTNWQKFQSLPELIIKPNFNETLKELKLSFPKDGKDIGHNDELTRIAAELLKKYGEAIKHFVITLGKDGAAYIRIKGSSFEITMVPAINSEPKKTKSAAHCGDVFTAALGLALTLENTDILSAVVFANLVGYLQYNKSDREKVSIQDLLN